MPSPLNKTETRARERREREAEAEQIAALEPDFPFIVIEFVPEFFDVPADPSDKLAPE